MTCSIAVSFYAMVGCVSALGEVFMKRKQKKRKKKKKTLNGMLSCVSEKVPFA